MFLGGGLHSLTEFYLVTVCEYRNSVVTSYVVSKAFTVASY